MRTSPKRLLPSALLTLGLLTACAHLTPTPVPSACTAFPRISFDRLHDTDETIRQVKAYDAGRDAVCGKGR